MVWIALAVLFAVLVLPRVLRRQRESYSVFPSQPISTLNSARAKKTNEETKAALKAASSLLK
jgi:hypothetical protein